MNPFDHMSQQFKNDNREALEEALFDRIVNPPDSIGDCIQEGISELGKKIGSGLALFGFWIGLGLAFFGNFK